MGYAHIENLYRNQAILMFKECWAMEKIHGTSAHIAWRDGHVTFFSGGSKHDDFVALFDAEKIAASFAELGHPEVVIYGEAYGGKINGQSWRYGKKLRFVSFEVKIGETFLGVENAAGLVAKFGLSFVHYRRVACDIGAIDAERDAPSEEARRAGVAEECSREGVVLRPLVEATLNGHRVIAKHKRDEERETKTKRVVSIDGFAILEGAEKIADEWVTPTRLQHVLDHLGGSPGIEKTPDVIAAMIEDVTREAAGEIVDSKEARRAIGRATVLLFKAHLRSALSG
jgi:hypothetical protein